MQQIIYLILAFVGAYLIGSIPSAVWVATAMYGADVRNFGSKNAGATNTFRVLGRGAGILVLAIDIAKGLSAAAIANVMLDADLIHQNDLTFFQIAFGVVAIVGHIFPVFAGFKGGKGVATMIGMVFTVQLNLALAIIGIFFIVLLLSKYVSLGSLVASFTFPLLLVSSLFEHGVDERTVCVSSSLFVIVAVTHRQNIQRLLAGNENKSTIRLRKKRARESEV